MMKPEPLYPGIILPYYDFTAWLQPPRGGPDQAVMIGDIRIAPDVEALPTVEQRNYHIRRSIYEAVADMRPASMKHLVVYAVQFGPRIHPLPDHPALTPPAKL
jgi:hypothetical protein